MPGKTYFLVEREINTNGFNIEDATKIYYSMAYGDLTTIVGAEKFGTEMYFGYVRWLSKNTERPEDRKKYQEEAILQKFSDFGGNVKK